MTDADRQALRDSPVTRWWWFCKYHQDWHQNCFKDWEGESLSKWAATVIGKYKSGVRLGDGRPEPNERTDDES